MNNTISWNFISSKNIFYNEEIKKILDKRLGQFMAIRNSPQEIEKEVL